MLERSVGIVERLRTVAGGDLMADVERSVQFAQVVPRLERVGRVAPDHHCRRGRLRRHDSQDRRQRGLCGGRCRRITAVARHRRRAGKWIEERLCRPLRRQFLQAAGQRRAARSGGTAAHRDRAHASPFRIFRPHLDPVPGRRSGREPLVTSPTPAIRTRCCIPRSGRPAIGSRSRRRCSVRTAMETPVTETPSARSGPAMFSCW